MNDANTRPTEQHSPFALVGHEDVRSLLRRLDAHALLFAGPERVGRRLVAAWYAAWLNCVARGEVETLEEPCGGCWSCDAIRSGSHPDYREIAPDRTTKSGRVSRRREIRIDQLVRREGGDPEPLGPWLETRPRGRYRVGVIDAAEALTPSAANAFLKTLEEPPSYAQIVLIASGPEAVLPTIASRSVHVRFGTVTSERVAGLAAGLLPDGIARLGRPGDAFAAREHEEHYLSLQDVTRSFVLALDRSLEDALEAADALEKHWLNEDRFDVGEALRALVSVWPPTMYAAACGALERCEEALAAYASTSLALQSLALELREIRKALR